MTKYSALLLAITTAASCGGPKTTDLTPVSSRDVLKDMPAWYLTVPQDDESLFAVGSATSRDMATALEKAKLVARGDLAQQLSTGLASLTNSFQEETGLGDDSEFLTQFSAATKAVTDEVLLGSRVDKQELLPEKDIYRAYVLVSLPLGGTRQALIERLQGDEPLLTRLRATEAFKELDETLRSSR